MLVGFSLMAGIEIPSFMPYLIGALGVFAFVSAEMSRFLTRYKILEDKIVIVKGLIKQAKKNVYFHPLGFVPDINIKQGRLQRFLGYGTLFIKHGGDNALEIKDINSPQKIMSTIEDLIESNRVITSRHPGQDDED